MKCRVCGCTDDRACEGGCSWVEARLCSQCKPKEDAAAIAVVAWLAAYRAFARSPNETLVERARAFREARLAAVDRLRVLPRGLIIDGVRYTAVPSRQEVRMRLLKPQRGTPA